MGEIVFGDQDDAACFSIQPVHDTGASRAAESAELLKVIREGGGESPRPMTPSRVHNHMRRLVDGDQIVIFVQHVQRNVLWTRSLSWHVGERNSHTHSGPN